jgi:hypothetical protein
MWLVVWRGGGEDKQGNRGRRPEVVLPTPLLVVQPCQKSTITPQVVLLLLCADETGWSIQLSITLYILVHRLMTTFVNKQHLFSVTDEHMS